MSKHYKRGLRMSIVLAMLFLPVQLIAQGIPTGSATTDTGLGGSNQISGMILTPSGGRIERRITVRLQSMTKGDRLSTSDEWGNFVFRGLPPGDYTIVIDKEKEFEPFSYTVSIIQPRGMPPVSQLISIKLKAKASEVAKPAVVSAEFAGVPKEALVTYAKGVELAKEGKSREAIAEFQAAIQQYADFTGAYNEIGVVYMRLGELGPAIDAFQNALKIDPKALTPLSNLGIGLFHLKKFPEAEVCFREALKLDANSVIVHHFLGKTLANMGKFDDAEKELVTALTLGGDDLNMKEDHRLLAIIYINRGEKIKAADQLEAYLKLAPTAPDAAQLREKIKQLRGN